MVEGELAFDDARRAAYATDASNYEMQPLGILTPRHADDVRAAVRLAASHGVSLLPRGGGTSLAGQTVGPGLVIDVSRHMTEILELDVERRRVRVQPGIVRDVLNEHLAPHGLFFSPETATSTRANIGGMIANNSSGMRSIRYGRTSDHVVALHVLLADGTEMDLDAVDRDTFAARGRGASREAEIYRGVAQVLENEADEIRARYPKILRRVGGYALDALLDAERPNLTSLVTGSEGTLAFILEATLDLDPLPPATGLAIVHFESSLAAIRAVPAILEHDPSAVELLDATVLEQAMAHPTIAKLCGFADGAPQAILLVEFIDDDAARVAERLARFEAATTAASIGTRTATVTDDRDQSRVWWVRKSGLGLLLGVKGDRKPMPCIEDAAVPVEHLAEYIEKVLALCRRLGVEVVMYAHASVGLLHVRPMLNLKEAADVERMKVISDEVLDLVVGYGGSVSGEHGDGRQRSPYIERFYGSRLTAAFARVKSLFDPDGRMNPGIVVDPEPMDRHLRYGAAYQALERETAFRYREDGSFAAAVEMCNGVGACRSTLAGVMCPSYRALRDELHTTRGRANVLRLAMAGKLGHDALIGEGVHEALDLCLSCKACKSECPSRVDMAKLKGEVYQMRHDRLGTPLFDRLVARAPERAAKLSGRLAPVANALQGLPIVRRALEATLGMDHRRHLPAFARQSLDAWLPTRGLSMFSPRRVALFADTYMRFHEPHIGRAAIGLLETLGYQVEVITAGCCQRPRISAGFLREATAYGEPLLRRLEATVPAERPILVVEPSCASAIVDDLADLIEDRSLVNRVVPRIKPLEAFLAEEMPALRELYALRSEVRSAVVHGHCHQRALFGTEALMSVLESVDDLDVRLLDTGCCGMAGAFGYHERRYDVSMAIGEDRLFPSVRELPDDTAIVACGTSCRHQIREGTGRVARHWVELIKGVQLHVD